MGDCEYLKKIFFSFWHSYTLLNWLNDKSQFVVNEGHQAVRSAESLNF